MREIKFRAWSEDEGMRKDTWELVDETHGSIKLMQYTGLKDKNGKEIYEGDIVSTTDGDFEVFYLTWATGFKLRHTAKELIDYDKKCEVIGNIYENPQLLKDRDE